ncbi:MAG: glycosyltransferase family 2 protein [Planctomycetota bacterium]|jgi:glycosyltransferase involved in cell wall biosynthesis
MMKLSVIIPVYNENTTIKKIINMVNEVDVKKEVIVVDDGSDDGTKEILRNIKMNSLKTVFHERNRGKGAAIRTGLKYVTGDIVIIQDADLEYDPQEYPKLIQPIVEGKAKVVYGSRFLRPLTSPKIYYHFVLGVKLLNLLTYLLYGVKTTDEATCYKVFRTEVIKNIELKCEGFEFCPEITAKICKKGYKIYEVPTPYTARYYQEGKKITWRDGVKAIYTLIKYRFID